MAKIKEKKKGVDFELKSEDEVFLICKDHSVSGEEFHLLRDPESKMLITFPKPAPEDLPSYYESPEYISHTDSTSSLTDKIYQAVKKFMLSKKLSWIENEFPEKGKILDFGAGTGDFLIAAKSRGWEVHGVEPEKKARARAVEKGLNLQADLSGLKFETFDVISLWHVLEHIPVPGDKIAELEKLLKPGGLLIIAVPNYKSYDAEYYKEYWAAYDVPRHLWHFSRTSFDKIFSGTDLKQEYSKAMIFDSFYVSLLSEKYKSGRINFLNAIITGLRSNIRAASTGEYSSLAYFFRKT